VRILFVSHQAVGTGAVVMLLRMQRWLAQHGVCEMETVFLKGGDQQAAFAELGGIHVCQPDTGLQRSLLQRAAGKTKRLLRHKPAKWPSFDYDAIYANTAVSLPWALEHNWRHRPVVAHLHEMPNAVRRHLGGRAGDCFSRVDRFIAVSAACAQGLSELSGRDQTEIALIPGFFDVPTEERSREVRATARCETGLPADVFLLGTCGSGYYQKGTDLLPSLLKRLPKSIKGREVHLVHIGELHSPYTSHELLDEADKLGVGGRLHFVGRQADAVSWLASLDIHLLPSREDSFPLVVLEAASAAIPTVCFLKSGGAPEFCDGETGIAVPFLDLDAMAQVCLEILSDDDARVAMGDRARERVLNDYTAEAVMPRWLQFIKAVVS
jgi:glycosyltransferase involved in cell wall biosynthesis